MNCLLVSATPHEIKPFLQDYKKSPAAGSVDIDLLIGGVGILSTAFHLSRQIQIKKPGLIIQAGIAGSFDPKFGPGAIAIIDKDLVADEGVFEKKQFKTVVDLGFRKPNSFPFHNGWLNNPHKKLLKQTRIPQVSGVTVNQVSHSKEMIALYRKKYRAVMESMEGAAFHYVCLQNNIPFIQLRAVSNMVGERNKKHWKTREAVTILNLTLSELLDNL
jgi:futalosine hydrolase